MKVKRTKQGVLAHLLFGLFVEVTAIHSRASASSRKYRSSSSADTASGWRPQRSTLCGGQDADGHELSQCLGATGGGRDDACAACSADAASLQEPSTVIAGREICGFAGDSHREQEGVVRVIGFDAVGRCSSTTARWRFNLSGSNLIDSNRP